MNRLICALLFAAALAHAAGAAGNHATLVSIVTVQKSIDGKLAHLWPDEPYFVLGSTHGVYLEGYGAVFTTEVNLVTAPINVFQPNPTREMIVRHHQRKIERLPQLEQAMRDLLLQTASSLGPTLADTDNVVLAVDLPSYAWEETGGVPTEIVMKGQKGALLAAAKDQLDKVIEMEEY